MESKINKVAETIYSVAQINMDSMPLLFNLLSERKRIAEHFVSQGHEGRKQVISSVEHINIKIIELLCLYTQND